LDARYARRIATVAQRIVARARHTVYQHSPVIDPTTGTYDVDCSAFVGYVVETAAPNHFLLIPRTGLYPLAGDFYAFFSGPAVRGWRRIARLQDAARGDVVAWPVATVDPQPNTGHVFAVARAPTFDPAANAWTVDLYDSADAVHFDDSRERGGTYHSGVGTGAVRLAVDARGAPVAFQFGPGDPFDSRPIAVGRIEAL
jgi:hypothetical protein